VYGGINVNATPFASVEMLSTDGRAWQTLPTPMYMFDNSFSSVALP
jgi:hypothetical protein